MKHNQHTKRMISSIVEIVIGAALMAASFSASLDSYWSGMGSGLIAVGVIFLLREIKYRRNPEYKEQVDTATNDERNKYLGMKAWSWTGYATVLTLAFAGIGCRISGQDSISTLLAGIVCLMMVLYWLIYVYLSKKY